MQESAPPSKDYTTAASIDFTIEKGVFTYELTMIDHNAKKETGEVTLDNVVFPTAQNWAHKLTHDEAPKFNGEVLYWKGNYYYSYKLAQTTKNPYKKQWDDKNLDLNDPSVPDPVEFYNTYKKETDSSDLVLKLGKLWNETSIKTVSAANPIQRGDLYLYNNRLYVYAGTEPMKKAPTGQPDEEKSYTGTDKERKVHKNWHQVSKNKYTIE